MNGAAAANLNDTGRSGRALNRESRPGIPLPIQGVERRWTSGFVLTRFTLTFQNDTSQPASVGVLSASRFHSVPGDFRRARSFFAEGLERAWNQVRGHDPMIMALTCSIFFVAGAGFEPATSGL